MSTTFLADVDAALSASGLPADHLLLELTESLLIERPEAVQVVLRQLKARGVQLLLDDYGSGYSSLGYLPRFPLDALKIDQAFIRDLDRPGNAAIVRSTILLAHELGLVVVAEGIETAVQTALLREWRCDFLQGFYFTRALPAEQALAWSALNV